MPHNMWQHYTSGGQYLQNRAWPDLIQACVSLMISMSFDGCKKRSGWSEGILLGA